MRFIEISIAGTVAGVMALAQTPPPNAKLSVDLNGTYRVRGENGPGGRGGRGGRGAFADGPPSPIFKINGQPPPLQPWAEKLYNERIASSQKGIVFRDTVSQCLPPGIPQAVLMVPYPVQVLQTPGQVTMLYEEQNNFRIIRLNQEHPPDVDQTYFGDSVGKWEGDTLVVDTIGLRDDITIDKMGLPQSTGMHVIERIRRLDANTLENRVTIDDPKAYTRKWEAVSVWRKVAPGDELRENICENRRFFQ